MPIGGVVVSVRPEAGQEVVDLLKVMDGVEVHGADEDGSIVVVLETDTTDAMERLMEHICSLGDVLQVGLTYLNVEDEAERIALGEYIPSIFGKRRWEKEDG